VRVGEGDKRKSFLVHKDLIVSRSDFFARALNGKWKEDDDNVVKLTEDEPEIFGLYIQLLYSGKLPLQDTPSTKDGGKVNTNRESAEKAKDYDGDSINEEFRKLCQVYVLSDKLQDTTAKNAIIDAYIESTNQHLKGGLPSLEEIKIVYSGTLPSSAMRRLIVDLYVTYGNSSDIDKRDRNVLAEDFLFELVVGMLGRRSLPNDLKWFLNSPDYHEKAVKKGKPCSRMLRSSTNGAKNPIS
jgi:hypothetical protein